MSKTWLPVYHSRSEPPPWEFVEEEEKISEHKIISEGDGDVRGGNGATVFAYLFHFWYYNPAAIPIYASLLMPTMWNFSWLKSFDL